MQNVLFSSDDEPVVPEIDPKHSARETFRIHLADNLTEALMAVETPLTDNAYSNPSMVSPRKKIENDLIRVNLQLDNILSLIEVCQKTVE
jgi:hypothetical protein